MNHQNFSEEIFKKSFFERRFVTLTLFQYFNSSAFLSRKRVQNYCFTAYPPNLRNTFLQEKCRFARKSLILKRCRRAYFYTSLERIQAAYTLIIIYKSPRVWSKVLALLSPEVNSLCINTKRVAAVLSPPCLSCHRVSSRPEVDNLITSGRKG